MTHCRDDVLAAARAFFPAEECDAVLAEVDAYGAAAHERERERVQVAIIELSAGNRDKLRENVKMAKVDYRDILAWKQLGQLPPEEGQALQAAARAVIEKWGKT